MFHISSLCHIVAFSGLLCRHAIVCSISYVKFVLQKVAIVCSTGGNSLFYREVVVCSTKNI